MISVVVAVGIYSIIYEIPVGIVGESLSLFRRLRWIADCIRVLVESVWREVHDTSVGLSDLEFVVTGFDFLLVHDGGCTNVHELTCL